MKIPTLFTIGSATFDIFAKAHRSAIMHFDTPQSKDAWLCIPYGGKLNVEEVHETFGGGATNTAIGFARMGFRAVCLAKVGTPYGDRVIDNLSQEGVDARHIAPTRKEKTGFSIILNSFEGERTVLYHRGANAFFSSRDLPLHDLARADWIFLNHVSAESTGIHHALIDLLKKNPGIKVCWNPGHEQLKQGARRWKSLLQHIEILFLNKEEAAEFSGNTFYRNTAGSNPKDRHFRPCKKGCRFLGPRADDLREIFRALFHFGPRIVVITDGQNGSQASDGRRVYYCPILQRERVDTLGAGDAFGTGFTSARMLGKGLKEALLYGTLNAGSVVQYFGAQQGLMTRSKLVALARKTNINDVSEDTL